MELSLTRRSFAAAALSAIAMSALPLSALASESAKEDAAESGAAESSEQDVDEGLAALAGTYTALMPSFREEKNDQVWRDALAEYCDIDDETQADQTKDAFLSMYEGKFYGNEAVALSANGYSTFDCYLEGVSTFTVDGNTISGADENGNQLFSHTYKYLGTLKGDFGPYNDTYAEMYASEGREEDWPVFTIYASEDATEDGFRYFAFGGDTPAETYHIEFRYGDHLDGITEYYTGQYGYFMPSAIFEDYSDEMMKNCVDLFVSENADSIKQIAASL